MKRKLTVFDLVLWAALPMAQSSKIERRLTMILDKARNRRTIARRVLLLALIPGTAALVGLAMLRPVAKAQTTSVGPDAVQIIGVADATAPSAAKWDRNGDLLPATAFRPLFRGMDEHISAPPGQRALSVAFRIPGPLQQSTRIIVNGSDAPLGRIMVTSLGRRSLRQDITMTNFQYYSSGGPVIYTAGFPAALLSASFLVGVASEQGAETVDCLKTPGKVRMSRPAGEVLFTLVPDRRALTPALAGDNLVLAEATRKNAVLMVSDHFHCPSPLPIDKMAVLISSYASRTRSGDAVQQLRHDSGNYERAVYGLDPSGRVVVRLAGSGYSEIDDKDRTKWVQTFSVPRPLLRRIASFRLIARPYQWTEFKNVALQPAK